MKKTRALSFSLLSGLLGLLAGVQIHTPTYGFAAESSSNQEVKGACYHQCGLTACCKELTKAECDNKPVGSWTKNGKCP